MARLLKMDTKDQMGSHGISNTRTNIDPIGFPSILKQEQTKQRIFVQRSKSFTARVPPPTARVPPPGHEYDFRRTPDPGRATPKKCIHGHIRPCIPAGTPVDTEMLHLNASPAVTRYRNQEYLAVDRCPTPMPTDSEYYKHTEPSAPLQTAGSMWDRSNLGTADVEDLADVFDDVDLQSPRYPVFKIQDRAGIRFKPANKPKKYDIIMSDFEENYFTLPPTSISPVNLTETVLHHYYHKSVNKDRRIARWLVDCKDKSANQLYTHLPDIKSATSRKNETASFEDVQRQ